MQDLTSDLFKFIKGLERISTTLLPYSDKDYRYLSYLLAGNVSQHPFKYLLVLFWLNSTLNSNNKPQVKNIERKYGIEEKLQLCQYLLKQGNSMAEVSRITGKSRCFLKVLAMKNNIPIVLKPKVITEEVISGFISMAYKGFHRKAIAKEFQVSTGSVEQIISSEEGLVEKRKQFKHQSKRRRYKVLILRILKKIHWQLGKKLKRSVMPLFTGYTSTKKVGYILYFQQKRVHVRQEKLDRIEVASLTLNKSTTPTHKIYHKIKLIIN